MAKIDFSLCPAPSEFSSEGCCYDIIGDVHGQFDALCRMLDMLGYTHDGAHITAAPNNRKLVFVGDICDRGNRSPECLELVRTAMRDGLAHMVLGNHEDKLRRRLKSGIPAEPWQESILAQDERFRCELYDFIAALPDHLILDGGRLVVAHAGITDELIGKQSGYCRTFTLYGKTTGEFDENGLPVRLDWTLERTERVPLIVYGHIPQEHPYFSNGTVDIDTGAGQGGRLTALRYDSQCASCSPHELLQRCVSVAVCNV